MANSKGSTNVRNLMYPGKHALLPPKSPFPSVAPSYSDYILTPAATAIGPKAVQKPRDPNPNPNYLHNHHHHQRTSSESVIAEEQPSWLDDLLDEPDTPVRKPGHRRSTSDSFAYVEQQQQHHAVDYSLAQDDYNYKYRNVISPSPAAPAPHQHHQLSWGSQEFDHQRDLRHWETTLARQKNRAWDHPGGIGSAKDGIVRQGSGSFSMAHELDGIPSTASEKFDGGEIGALDQNSYDKGLGNRPSSSDTDTKRAKQQFAQRSRVRKLQYIAELERNVQSLQSEGSEVSAELEFLNQQNLILSMENKALKQRLESLAQEHLIKHLEHEVLEREIGRLRTLYQQQLQPQPPPPSSHRRSNSRDLDSQFSNLSLKHKDSNPGQLRI